MSSKEHAHRLGHALVGTGFAEPVSTTWKDNQVTIIFRVATGVETKWVEIAKAIYMAEKQNEGLIQAWKTDISKLYFMKGNKLVYGWRISVMSQDMSLSLDHIIMAMKGELQPDIAFKGEISEMAFTGFEGATDRNVPKMGSKKGAYRAETIPIDRR